MHLLNLKIVFFIFKGSNVTYVKIAPNTLKRECSE